MTGQVKQTLLENLDQFSLVDEDTTLETVKLSDGTLLSNLHLIRSTSTSHFYSACVFTHFLKESKLNKVYVKQRTSTDKKKEEELKKLLQLSSHSHIIKLFDAISFSDPFGTSRFAFVMEFAKDGDLSQVLQSDECTTEQANYWICQISHGLVFLHENEIAHGNLKPKKTPKTGFSILFFGENKQIIKLTDFGEVKRLKNSAIPLWDEAYCYMAPEVLRYTEGNEVLLENYFPADIYSLAIICWEILHRRPPFKFRSVLKFYAELSDGLRPKFETRDCELHDFIQRCWDKSPNARESAGNVRDFVLQWFRSSVGEKEKAIIEELHGLEATSSVGIVPDKSLFSYGRCEAFENVKRYSEADFEVITLIDTGGGAQIYKAKNLKKMDVCLKFFRFDIDRKSTENECDLLWKLRHHQNIVHMLGFLVTDSIFGKKSGLVMEFMAGGSLNHVIHSDRHYTDHDAYNWILQAGQALEYIHNYQIIHRDVKPPNMLLDNDYRVLKLCDLGTALEFPQTDLTFGVGTYQYMAPEIIDGVTYTIAVDVYSLGISVWEILHRKRPLETEKSLCQFLIDTSNGVRPVISDSLNCDVKNVLNRMWDADPEQRPILSELFGTFKKFHETSKQDPRQIQMIGHNPEPMSTKAQLKNLTKSSRLKSKIQKTDLPMVQTDEFKVFGTFGEKRRVSPHNATCAEFGNITIFPCLIGTDFAERFPVLAKLRHPNIIHILALACCKSRIEGYITEAVHRTLGQVIYSRMTIDTATIYIWTTQIARALKYLHQKNIIHRNIHPNSIYLTKSGKLHLQLGGFQGIRGSTSIVHTATKGEPKVYTAPEALLGQDYTTSSDIYSLSMTLFEIIHRKKPFELLRTKSVLRIYKSLIEGARPSFDDEIMEQNGLKSIIERAWDTTPSERPLLSEITDFVEKLQAEQKSSRKRR